MITLRDATFDDLALIDDLHCRGRRATCRGQVSDHELDVAMPAASLADWQAKLPQRLAAGGCVRVAESDGQPVGVACACARAVDDDGVVTLNNLHALPERKGQGVGTALAAEVARHARAMQLRGLESNAPAIGFRESRGWRRIGREDHVLALRYELALT